MIVITAAEHFALNQETRDEVEAIFSDLARFLPETSTLRLHLKIEGRDLIFATLAAHVRHEDYTFTEVGADIRTLASILSERLERRLLAQKNKWLRNRRRRGTPNLRKTEDDLQSA